MNRQRRVESNYNTATTGLSPGAVALGKNLPENNSIPGMRELEFMELKVGDEWIRLDPGEIIIRWRNQANTLVLLRPRATNICVNGVEQTVYVLRSAATNESDSDVPL